MDMKTIGVIIRITKQCNLKCEHCYINSKGKEGPYLSRDKYLTLLKKLKGINKIRVNHFRITGGEFTILPYHTELISLSKKYLNNVEIRLDTNGLQFLKNPTLFEYYRGTDLYHVSIDLWHGTVKEDGSCPIIDLFKKKRNEFGFKLKIHWTDHPDDWIYLSNFYKKYFKSGLELEVAGLERSGRARNLGIHLYSPYLYRTKCSIGKYIYVDYDGKIYGCHGARKRYFLQIIDDSKDLIRSLKLLLNRNDCKLLYNHGFIGLLNIFKKLFPAKIKYIINENPGIICNICDRLYEYKLFPILIGKLIGKSIKGNQFSEG